MPSWLDFVQRLARCTRRRSTDDASLFSPPSPSATVPHQRQYSSAPIAASLTSLRRGALQVDSYSFATPLPIVAAPPSPDYPRSPWQLPQRRVRPVRAAPCHRCASWPSHRATVSRLYSPLRRHSRLIAPSPSTVLYGRGGCPLGGDWSPPTAALPPSCHTYAPGLRLLLLLPERGSMAMPAVPPPCLQFRVKLPVNTAAPTQLGSTTLGLRHAVATSPTAAVVSGRQRAHLPSHGARADVRWWRQRRRAERAQRHQRREA